MPSTSPAQQRLMGMALAVKRGEQSTASPKVKSVVRSMSVSQLRDFAHTPETVHAVPMRHRQVLRRSR